jgi:hypothetical protein
MNTLSVKISNSKNGGFEGTVSILGLKPTKLARKIDGKTNFPTKSSVSGAARNLAKSLGFSDIDLSYDE